MGKVLIKDTTLTDIANAIRTKDGSTAKMYPREMAGKILSVPTGEKRLIAKKIVCNTDKSSSMTVKGTGYLMISNTQAIKKIRIDGQAVDNKFIIKKDQDGDWIDINPTYFKLTFKNSCSLPDYNYESSSRDSYNIAVTGEYTDEILEGNPDQIYIGYDAVVGVNITGKGFAIISGNDGGSDQTRIYNGTSVDGVNVITDQFVNVNETPIRIDFNKSIFFPKGERSFVPVVYVWK